MSQYRFNFPVALNVFLLIANIGLGFMIFVPIINEGFRGFDYFLIIVYAFSVGALIFQYLTNIKGRYILEKEQFVIKTPFGTRSIPYTQIRHIDTSRPKAIGKFFLGVKDIVIEIDLGRENPRVINTNEQEAFLAELRKRMGSADDE